MANLIAEIEAMGQKKMGDKGTVALVVKLKEANGKSFDWTSWHVNSFNDYSIGDVIEIVPELKTNPKSQYPYRNIGSVVGKRTQSDINTLDITSGDIGAPKPTTSTSFNGGGRYSSPEAQVYERRSIERQGSIGKVLGFLEHMSLDELDENIGKILIIAGKIEAHVQRDGGLLWPVQSNPIKSPPASSQSANEPSNGHKSSSPNGNKIPENVPELLTMASKLFRKNKHDVCMAFSIPDEEWADIADRAGSLTEAWESLVNIWSGPTE